MSGSQGSSLIHPVNGYRDSLRRKGVQPRNHAKENLAALRQRQRDNREMKENAQKEERFVMKRFQGVSSRIEVRVEGSTPCHLRP